MTSERNRPSLRKRKQTMTTKTFWENRISQKEKGSGGPVRLSGEWWPPYLFWFQHLERERKGSWGRREKYFIKPFFFFFLFSKKREIFECVFWQTYAGVLLRIYRNLQGVVFPLAGRPLG